MSDWLIVTGAIIVFPFVLYMVFRIASVAVFKSFWESFYEQHKDNSDEGGSDEK